MKTFDDNWQALKGEDYSIPEPKPHSMSDAEDLKIVFWFNNTKQQKFTWRERMSPNTAWLDLGDDKGMWRTTENRLFEEIQYEYATQHFGQGYRVVRSTPRFEDGSLMLNAKTIHIFKEGELQEIVLILDGTRVYSGYPTKVKNGQAWKFNQSVHIQNLI